MQPAGQCCQDNSLLPPGVAQPPPTLNPTSASRTSQATTVDNEISSQPQARSIQHTLFACCCSAERKHESGSWPFCAIIIQKSQFTVDSTLYSYPKGRHIGVGLSQQQALYAAQAVGHAGSNQRGLPVLHSSSASIRWIDRDDLGSPTSLLLRLETYVTDDVDLSPPADELFQDGCVAARCRQLERCLVALNAQSVISMIRDCGRQS